MADFQVFLSYSHRDQAAVRAIYDQLGEYDVRAWFDAVQITPADVILDRMSDGLAKSAAVAVFYGPDGFGQFHREEMWAALQDAIQQRKRLIPVLLPGHRALEDDAQAGFLRLRKAIEFSTPQDADAVEALAGAVGGTRRQDEDRPPPPPVDPIDRPLNELHAAVEGFGCLTIFLGAGAGSSARPDEIARDLLRGVDLIPEGYSGLLPWPDSVAAYFEASNGPATLEKAVVTMLASRTSGASALHTQVARLAGKLVAALKPADPRAAPEEPVLIVTTALDLMCERALLRAGVGFTRIVQHWSGSELTINEYGGESVSGMTDGQLDAAIKNTGRRTIRGRDDGPASRGHPIRNLALGQFRPPFLYKYHGSQDVAGSCTLSTDHYLRLAARPAIPDKLYEIIGNSPALFIPRGGLDGDVKHVYQTLLCRAYQVGQERLTRVAVLNPRRDPEPDSYRQQELHLWPRVITAFEQEMRIAVVLGSAEEFTRRLADRIPTPAPPLA